MDDRWARWTDGAAALTDRGVAALFDHRSIIAPRLGSIAAPDHCAETLLDC
jgi:hypothetical protein